MKHLPKTQPQRREGFRFHEWLHFLKHVDPWYQPVLELMILTGMINSEIAGYGELLLLFKPPRDLGEGVFLRFTLSKLPDPTTLGSAISAAAGALRNDVAMGN